MSYQREDCLQSGLIRVPADSEFTTINEKERPEIPNRKNYICNFRAPDAAHFQMWHRFKQETCDRGLDICYVVLALCNAWLNSLEKTTGVCQITTSTQIINLQQQNTFVYAVQKPRREPIELTCSSKVHPRTLISSAFQTYVLSKARDLDRSFSYRDFPELKHDFFRKRVLELRSKREIIPLIPRTNPRFYILREWSNNYPVVSENNGVKPGFAEVLS